VDAADWLRHDLDVSKPLWGKACSTMRREQAAIALAVASLFRTTPGGYFHGMVPKRRPGVESRSHAVGDAATADRPWGEWRPSMARWRFSLPLEKIIKKAFVVRPPNGLVRTVIRP
jgi:hypothetical protein